MGTLYRSDIIPSHDFITELDLLPILDMFPKNICDQCGIPTGDAYSSGHLVPSHLGLAYSSILLVETYLFPELFPLFFRTMQFEHPSIFSRFCLQVPSKNSILRNPMIILLTAIDGDLHSSFYNITRQERYVL